MTTFTTPGGMTPSHSSAKRRLESGAWSAAFTTTVLPAASAAAAFSAQKRNGWLKALILATTP